MRDDANDVKSDPARNLPSTDEPRSSVAGDNFRTRDHADQDFGEAFIHSAQPHRVLGFRLLPHSFWHACLLDYIESPFAGYAGKMDFASLYAAVRICQMRYPHRPRRGCFEYLRELYLARKYNDAFKLTARAGKFVREISPFLRELNKFSAYIRDYFARPTYVPKSDGKPIHTPWYFYEVSLLKRFNPELSWAQCWDAPIGEGSWQNVGMCEAHGNEVSILTPAQRIAFNNAREVRKPSAKLLARIAEVQAMPARVRYRTK